MTRRSKPWRTADPAERQNAKQPHESGRGHGGAEAPSSSLFNGWLRRDSDLPRNIPLSDVSVDIADSETMAPTVGEVFDTFASHLDAPNLFRLPTVVADAGWIGPFWLAAASLTGLAHLHRGTTGQDNYSFAVGKDVVVASVADGLGSRPATAQLGATFATRALCSRLLAVESSEISDADTPFHDAINDVNSSMLDLLGNELSWMEDRDLSCTIAFMWVSFPPNGRGVVGRVGDCAAFTLSRGSFSSLFHSEVGPLNIVSEALPGDRPSDSLQLAAFSTQDADVALLTTDGMADDLYSSPSVREWLATSWADRPKATRMIDSLRYRRRGSHDDRTALAIWLPRVEEGPQSDNG